MKSFPVSIHIFTRRPIDLLPGSLRRYLSLIYTSESSGHGYLPTKSYNVDPLCLIILRCPRYVNISFFHARSLGCLENLFLIHLTMMFEFSKFCSYLKKKTVRQEFCKFFIRVFRLTIYSEVGN